MKRIVTASLITISLCCSSLMAQVIAEDLAVQGSECIGFDCVNAESFGFDTLRLKENNLRIHFDDTSASASFPSNDWRIIINDTSNGGANKFSIEDSTAGRVPLTIEAGAPANSLYVDDGGRLGLGTSTPVTDIHTKTGNTPTLRLEQDGSSGFTPQTWDMAGNEANFFIRDATNGSKMPFRIKLGAPTNSIFINTNGDVGVGTASPSANIDVVESGASGTSTLLRLASTTSDVSFVLENTQDSLKWVMRTLSSNSGYSISKASSGGKEVVITGMDEVNGMEMIMGSGGKYSNGQWMNASSRAYKENIEDLDTETAMQAFHKLETVTYNYKTNKEESVVGFIAEDVPNTIAPNDHKSLSALEIAALLTKVVQVQDEQIQNMQSEINELKSMQK